MLHEERSVHPETGIRERVIRPFRWRSRPMPQWRATIGVDRRISLRRNAHTILSRTCRVLWFVPAINKFEFFDLPLSDKISYRQGLSVDLTGELSEGAGCEAFPSFLSNRRR